MNIIDAQREMRSAFLGGFAGQLVSGLIWLGAAAISLWVAPLYGDGRTLFWQHVHLPANPAGYPVVGASWQDQPGQRFVGARRANRIHRTAQLFTGWRGDALPRKLVFSSGNDRDRCALPPLYHPVWHENVRPVGCPVSVRGIYLGDVWPIYLQPWWLVDRHLTDNFCLCRAANCFERRKNTPGMI